MFLWVVRIRNRRAGRELKFRCEAADLLDVGFNYMVERLRQSGRSGFRLFENSAEDTFRPATVVDAADAAAGAVGCTGWSWNDRWWRSGWNARADRWTSERVGGQTPERAGGQAGGWTPAGGWAASGSWEEPSGRWWSHNRWSDSSCDGIPRSQEEASSRDAGAPAAAETEVAPAETEVAAAETEVAAAAASADLAARDAELVALREELAARDAALREELAARDAALAGQEALAARDAALALQVETGLTYRTHDERVFHRDIPQRTIRDASTTLVR